MIPPVPRLWRNAGGQILVVEAEPVEAVRALLLRAPCLCDLVALALRELDRLSEPLAVAQDLELHFPARPLRRYVFDQIAGLLHLAPVHRQHDVTVLDARLARRRVVDDLGHEGPTGLGETKGLRPVEVDIADVDADIAAR